MSALQFKRMHKELTKPISVLFFLMTTGSVLVHYVRATHQVCPRPIPSNVTAKYEDIPLICSEYFGPGWTRFTMNNDYVLGGMHSLIIGIMNESNLNSVWMPIRRKLLVQSDSAVSQGCRAINLRDSSVKVKPCGTSGMGFICQIEFCPSSRNPYNCFRFRTYHLLVGCDAGSWYDARNRCYEHKAEMADINSEEDLSEIVKNIKEPSTRRCKEFWVNYRDSEWVWDIRRRFHGKFYKKENCDMLDGPEVKETYWDEGEPGEGFNCVIIKNTSKGFFWRTAECNKNHAFICMAALG